MRISIRSLFKARSRSAVAPDRFFAAIGAWPRKRWCDAKNHTACRIDRRFLAANVRPVRTTHAADALERLGRKPPPSAVAKLSKIGICPTMFRKTLCLRCAAAGPLALGHATSGYRS